MTERADRISSLVLNRGIEGSPASWEALCRLGGDMDVADAASHDDPPRAVFMMMGDRWTSLILIVLATGDWHYGTLRRIIGALSEEGTISKRILTLKLRALERNGFVIRRTINASVTKTSYGLSGMGVELERHISTVLAWTLARQERILSNRATFDARTAGVD